MRPHEEDEKSQLYDPEPSSPTLPTHARVKSKQENDSSSSKPAIMATGIVRYARYILFAIFGIIVIYLISTSSLPTYTEPLRDSAGKYLGNLKGAHEETVTTTDASGDVITQITTGLAAEPTSPNPQYGTHGDLTSSGPSEKMNATFVTLARNTDLWEIARSIRQVEDRFNRNYHYDWVFLNDKPFDETFKKVTSSLVSGKTHYGEIKEEHWSFPSWIDQDKARKVREDMAQRKIIYGDSISYRHMCRFESGFFFRQPLMMNYEWYWRVEPSVELFCDVNYDPFKFMRDNKKKYSFVISLYEYVETIPTLWDSVKKFMKNHPEHIVKDNSLALISDDGGDTYNKCHFWSNFEIGNLEWLRSKQYVDFFEALDKDGGFFYERWGDAPVHSIGASLLLDKSEIHFFNDIAYYHVPFTHCPTGEETRLKLKCHCDPKNNFDWKGYSCTSRFFDLNKLEKPAGWEKEQ